MSTENSIVNEVRDSYVRDERIPHAGEIAMSERQSNLTLRGTLGSLQQIHAAVQIAKSVPGVGAVYNELSLDPRDRWQDGEIRGAALQALISNDRVPADHIDVHVRSSWLTLTGEVKHQQENDAAFDTASRIEGVGGITNEIKVITAGTQ